MEYKTGDLQHVLTRCGEASAMPDAVGQTALFYAVQRPVDAEARLVTERLIRESNLDPVRKDFGGQSPLFYAAAVGNIDTVKYLVSECGCAANENDNLSQSPLFYASRDGRSAVVRFLLEQYPAQANDIDRNGQTALFYAARENHKEVCSILIEFGASVDHRDLTGRRPSYFARLANHNDLAEYLESFSRDSSSDTRKRYRVVLESSEGANLTPSVEQLEELERRFPEICVWAKTGPIATGLAIPLTPPSPASKAPQPAHLVRKKQPPPAPAPKPIWMTIARQIVSDIFKQEHAWIFLRPVDPIRDQCPDYLRVIPQPMDFGTIRKKMGKYMNKSEFLADVDLIFGNCKIYNKPGTLPDVLCQRTETFYKSLLEQYNFEAIPDSTNVKEDTSFLHTKSPE